ncbi:agmatine deiminase family protein [Trinickia fusca]
MTAAKPDGSTDLPLSRNIAREDLLRVAAQLSRFESVAMLVDTSRATNLNLGDQDLADANAFLTKMANATGNKNTYQSVPTAVTSKTIVPPYEVDANGLPLGRILVGLPSVGPHAGEPLPPVNAAGVSFPRLPINDLWTRDTAPIFAKGSDGSVYGVNFNFNGWGQGFGRNNDGLGPSSNNANGLRSVTGLAAGYRYDTVKMGPYNASTGLGGVTFQPIDGDMNIAGAVNLLTGAGPVSTWLTMEGGGVEFNGKGLAVMAQSAVINANRNPGKTTDDVARELDRVLGIKKIYWIPGIKAAEITDGHVDFYMRFPSMEGSSTTTTIVTTWDGGTLNAADSQPTSTDGLNLAALLAALPGGSSPITSSDENVGYFGVANPTVKVWQPLPATATAATMTLGPITINQIAIGNLAAALQTPNQINVVLLPTPDLGKVKATVNARSTGINNAVVTYRNDFENTFAAGYLGYYEANRCIVMAQFGDSTTDLLAFQILQTLYPDRYLIQITTDGIANGGGTIHCATQQQIV